eukprot:scaffold19891_cov44-Attheya_sp.AAC.1
MEKSEKEGHRASVPACQLARPSSTKNGEQSTKPYALYLLTKKPHPILQSKGSAVAFVVVCEVVCRVSARCIDFLVQFFLRVVSSRSRSTELFACITL